MPRRRLKRETPEELAVPAAQDDFNPKGVGIEVDFSLPAERVIRNLNPSSEERSFGPFPDPPPHRMARQARHHKGRQWPGICQFHSDDLGVDAGHRP